MLFHYLSLPFKVLWSFFTVFTVFLAKKPEDGSERLDCKTFNQLYYFLNKEEALDNRLQNIKRSFLQKSWGITKYQGGVVKVDADANDLLYSALGAVKDYELGMSPDSFEMAVCGIIDNDLAIKSIKYADIVPIPDANLGIFRPSYRLSSENAMAIIVSLSILDKLGNQEAKALLSDLLWKKLYILLILFPNWHKIESVAVGFFLLSKVSKGFLLLLSKNTIILPKMVVKATHNYFAEYLLKGA